MKNKIIFLSLLLLLVKPSMSQVISAPQPFISKIFCNSKSGNIVVKVNGLNGVWIGCTVKIVLGMRSRMLDLPAKWVVGEQKVVFKVILSRCYVPGLASQEIIYSHTIALWEKAVPRSPQGMNINDPSTYYLTGLIPGSWHEGICK